MRYLFVFDSVRAFFFFFFRLAAKLRSENFVSIL